MSKPLKLLAKMRQNPNNWRIEELETIAKNYSINVRKSGGSHVVFEHPSWVELLSVPSRRPIKAIYIKIFLLLVDALGDE